MFNDSQQPEFEEIKRYVNSVIDGEPIDFDELKFSDLNQIKKQNLESVNTAERLFWKDKIKPLMISSSILFISLSIAPEGSLRILLAFLLIISFVFLCVALLKGALVHN